MINMTELPKKENGRIDWQRLAKRLGAPNNAAVARALDITPNAWAKIAADVTKTPQGSTQVKIQNWILEKTGQLFEFEELFPENFRGATSGDNAA